MLPEWKPRTIQGGRRSHVRSGALKPSHSLERYSSPKWEISSTTHARRKTDHWNSTIIGYDSDAHALDCRGHTEGAGLEG